MVVLGMFQIAFSAVCVTCGFIDAIFRTESQLGKTRAPVWAGMVNLYFIFCVLFCSVFVDFFPPLIPVIGGGRGARISCQLFPCFMLFWLIKVSLS